MATSQHEDKFTILLVADNFDPHFAPICHSISWGNWKLASVKLLDLALDWISLINTPDTPNILIISSTLREEDLDEFRRKWAYDFKSFRAVRFENCLSVGQIMREVESRNLLPKGEFLLIENLATFCSSNLCSQIEAFRNRRKKDKNCVMSLFYSRQISGEQRFVGFETNSKKLLVYQGNKDRATTEYTKNMFTTQSTIRADLAPCGIALCSTEIMLQFADNVDYELFDQVIHEILVNEDLHLQTINVEILPESVMAFSASDYGSLLRAQRLLVHRWCYPLTYDRLPTRVFENRIPLRYHRNHVYVPRNEEPPVNAEGTVLDRENDIARDVTLLDVTMGKGGCLKEEAVLRNVIAGDNITVGKGTVIDGVVIGDNVTIGSNCKIRMKTVIGSGVNIPNGTVIASNLVVMSTPSPEENDDIESHREPLGYYSWKLLDEPNGHFWRRSQSFSRARHERHTSLQSRSSLQHSISVDHGSASGNELPDSFVASDIPDINLDTEFYFNDFMKEICESMKDTFDSENRSTSDAINNLSVEINCSRLANGISPEDLTRGVFSAFLSLPPFKTTKQLALIKQLFIEWKPLWMRYYRTHENKLQLCHAIEDGALENSTIRALMPQLFMCIFENFDDMEQVIISWYDSLPQDSILRPDMAKLVEWLMEDEDEGEDDSDEEEDA
uniref:EIF-2B GDP-GTP exchange factor subunit epsilon n=1 Tax=Panagrolaimus sp. ES5 TaxID=591445 RepID=A0AC34GRD8_9BILA